MAADKDPTWQEFSQDSSVHGIGYIFAKSSPPLRRIIWLILFLGSLSFFTYTAYGFLNGYVRKYLATKITVETADKLVFPTTTICNNNLWTRSELNLTSTLLGSPILFEVMKDMYDITRPSPPPEGKYNASNPLQASLFLLSANDSVTFLERAAHTLNSTIVRCDIFGVEKPCASVFTTVPTDGGHCFQFNSDGELNATSAGKSSGIQLLMNVNVEEYTTGPNSHSEGMSFTFHDSHEVPMVTEMSVGLMPGTHASIILHKSETARYPPPADDNKANCFDTENLPNPLHYYKSYSYSACQVECKTAYVIHKCGCRDPLQPPLNDTEICRLPVMLYCSTPALDEFPGDDEEGLGACNCRNPCSESEYTPKISTFRFPSSNYIREQQISGAEIEYLQKNFIMVDIFYGKMSYHKLKEYLPYTIFDVIANLGGTLGLCIGASILSLFEFLEFGVSALVGCIKARGLPKKPTKVDVEEFATAKEAKYIQS